MTHAPASVTEGHTIGSPYGVPSPLNNCELPITVRTDSLTQCLVPFPLAQQFTECTDRHELECGSRCGADQQIQQIEPAQDWWQPVSLFPS